MIFTENVLLASIAAVAAVIVVVVLVCVVKYGFRIEIGWLYFHAFADAPKGIAGKELERLIESKLAGAIETHMAAMESYKDAARQCDDNTKALIARKLSDVQIPQLLDADFTKSKILAVSVKMELLILNVENHYAHAAESIESLTAYLTNRFDRLCQVFGQFSDDPAFVRHSAFVVLASWWSVVRPALIQAANQKITFDETARGVFTDTFWRKRIEQAIQEQCEILDVLEPFINLKELVSDHLRNMCSDHTVEIFKQGKGPFDDHKN